MDPGRFVAQHQQQFLILGFHDEERSDQDFEVRSDEEAAVAAAAAAAAAAHQQPHPLLRLSFSGSMRNSPSAKLKGQLSDATTLTNGK